MRVRLVSALSYQSYKKAASRSRGSTDGQINSGSNHAAPNLSAWQRAEQAVLSAAILNHKWCGGAVAVKGD